MIEYLIWSIYDKGYRTFILLPRQRDVYNVTLLHQLFPTGLLVILRNNGDYWTIVWKQPIFSFSDNNGTSSVPEILHL